MIYDETGIHGVFALFDGAEPTYAHIEEGEWLNDEPYVTIHRLEEVRDHPCQGRLAPDRIPLDGAVIFSRRASVRVPVRGRRYSLRRGLSVAPDHSGFIVEPYSILISARTFCGSTHG